MKPTDELIKWLQAHPAVWEALQEEWEKRGLHCGDKCVGITIQEQGILGTIHKHLTKDTDGQALTGWAVSEEQSGQLHWYCNRPTRVREEWRWLPTLGQLVRMLEKTECGFTLYSPDVEGGEPEYTLSSYEIVDFDMDEYEPEIACLALWAKVKGVE